MANWVPNTFPIRNLIPEPSNQLVSHTLCIRGYLVHKYVSFTQTFVCLVKQTGDSDYTQHLRQRIAAHEDRGVAKNAGSHSGDSAGDLIRGLDSKPK